MPASTGMKRIRNSTGVTSPVYAQIWLYFNTTSHAQTKYIQGEIANVYNDHMEEANL